jgi:hypothetical protein
MRTRFGPHETPQSSQNPTALAAGAVSMPGRWSPAQSQTSKETPFLVSGRGPNNLHVMRVDDRYETSCLPRKEKRGEIGVRFKLHRHAVLP